MRDLYHGDQMLRFVEMGWAVVAPDYAGLGTNGRVEFLTPPPRPATSSARCALRSRPEPAFRTDGCCGAIPKGAAPRSV